MSSNEDDSDNSDDANINDLFASYYGIEAQGEKKEGFDEDDDSVDEDSGNIDSPNFNADHYVQTMLNTQQAQDLLANDIKLVHDIRSLDSDMQMLVYENYNKFIAATDTIKRMKSNVEAMDTDMNTVKAKMSIISAGSEELDKSLENKNNRVLKKD